MATDAYVIFNPYGGKPPSSESQTDWSQNTSGDNLWNAIKNYGVTPTGATISGGKITLGNIFEIEDYSFDVEQTLNIGSQSGGTGAGKITFNPFSITRKIDVSSPTFFQMCCAGTAFAYACLALRKSVGAGGGGANTAGFTFLRFDFKLVAVKTLSWSHDEESPKETVTFAYGALQIHYCVQNPDGSLQPEVATGWNMVKNVADVSTATL